MSLQDGMMTQRRLPRLALFAGWTALAVLLFVLSPGTLSALNLGFGWLTGILWLMVAVGFWNSPARLGRVPVRLVLTGVGATFLVIAALQTYQALT